MCCAWVITDYQRPSAVHWRKAHVIAVDSENDTRTCWRPTWSAATLHLPSSKSLALDRSDWRSHCKTSVQQFEAGRVRTLETKREQRKTGTYLNDANFPCDVWGRSCASRIGHSPTRVYCDPRSVVSTAQFTTPVSLFKTDKHSPWQRLASFKTRETKYFIS